MLSTRRTSRTRLLSGAAAVGVLTLTGLGLTASGTQAAASVRDRVETATGVTLSSIAAPTVADLPVPLQASELPVPPQASEPPVPPAPRVADEERPISTIRTTDDGKSRGNKVMAVRRGKDGTTETQTYPSVEAMLAAMPDVPAVSSQNCDGADEKQLVLSDVKDGRRRLVLCTNRIAKVRVNALVAVKSAQEIKRDALQAALASLHATRASLATNPSIPAEARADAVKGIDGTIREVTAQMNDAD